MFTVTMPMWVSLVIIVPLVLLAIVSFLAALQLAARLNRQMDAETEAFQFERERDDARKQRDKLNTENAGLHIAIQDQAKRNANLVAQLTELHAQLADRNEALQEARAAIENLQTDLHMATVPMQEAAKSDMPLSYAEAKPAIDKAAQSTKRPRRGKITGTNNG